MIAGFAFTLPAGIAAGACILSIGSLKAGFVTERSELGSCRAFRFQYPILIGIKYAVRLPQVSGRVILVCPW